MVLASAALADLVRRTTADLGDYPLGWRDRAGGDTELRSGAKLVGTDDYEVWLLCWPQGTSVSPHDHGRSAGAFAVVAGELTELRWPAGRLVARRLDPGQVVAVPCGTVHDVISPAGLAYSVHAYSPPLSTMSFYDDRGRHVLRTEAVADTSSDFDLAAI
ncbi:MAG TPA: cysteine dioxygenase family protein [Acidimicrobiales bacterium]|jgi:quercetin dioxygenase-like cupin family protein|nr:cysteine dioxygenase family protein [Acidimicrobiales bacterium]